MHEIINKIVQQNQSLFGTNLKIDKINIGFTNTIYNINDLYIVKICTDEDNEKEFKKEIDFYDSNKNNNLIPKLYCSSINKKDVPYFYEIIEKVLVSDLSVEEKVVKLIRKANNRGGNDNISIAYLVKNGECDTK